MFIIPTLVYLPSLLSIVVISAITLINKGSRATKLFGVFAFAVAGWLLPQYIIQATDGHWQAILLVRIVTAVSLLLGYFFLLFAYAYTKRVMSGRRAILLFLPSLVLGSLCLTDIVIQKVEASHVGIAILEAGVLYFVITALVFIYISYGLFLVLVQTSQLPRSERSGNYALLFALGQAVVLLAGAAIFFTDSELAQLISPAALSIMTGIIAYTIVRHHTFDIKLAAVRTITYALALVTLGAMYYLLVYIASMTLLGDEANNTTVSASPINIFLALLTAFIFQPVKKFFDKFTNSIFYRDTYHTDEFYADLSELLASSTELRGLLERASHEIATTLKAEQAFFFVYYTNGVNHHMSAGTRGHNKMPLADARLLDEYIRDYGRLILTDMLPDNAKIRRVLISHKISLLMPLTSGNRIIGYFCLGDRRSSSYTKRDLKVLHTIADELVIAIQNALSVHEIKEINATLQQRIDVATKELRDSNAQLQRLDIAKDEFVSMASHQLRTPLTSVKGYISMLLDGDAGKLTETQQKLLTEAFKSSERMVGLISDFLSVSRVQTGRFVLEMHTVNLLDLVKQEVDSLMEMARTHDLTLELEAPKDPVLVQLDEEKIRQIVMNFIDNAVYYTHAGGAIKVALTVEDDDAVLTVTDSGIGVPEKEQAKLFSKFYRASNARKQRPDGTGVGLYLAKKVIVGHRGKLVFSSQEGKGSTFGFSLPILSADEINKTDNNDTEASDKPTHN